MSRRDREGILEVGAQEGEHSTGEVAHEAAADLALGAALERATLDL
jgi:hypothetical protein